MTAAFVVIVGATSRDGAGGTGGRFASVIESRSGKSAKGDKWSFCLKAAMMVANRRDHEQTSPPESLTGLQGEGGACRHPGRPDTGPIGRAFRRPPQSGHRLESPT